MEEEIGKFRFPLKAFNYSSFLWFYAWYHFKLIYFNGGNFTDLQLFLISSKHQWWEKQAIKCSIVTNRIMRILTFIHIRRVKPICEYLNWFQHLKDTLFCKTISQLLLSSFSQILKINASLYFIMHAKLSKVTGMCYTWNHNLQISSLTFILYILPEIWPN